MQLEGLERLGQIFLSASMVVPFPLRLVLPVTVLRNGRSISLGCGPGRGQGGPRRPGNGAGIP